MNATAQAILDHMQNVEMLREARAADSALATRVRAVKAYQHARFLKTYADLMSSERYAAATRFFLDELYGPHDFTKRDRQFSRIVPALVRLFPLDVVETVETVSALHALSESLDTQMGRELERDAVDAAGYVRAWQRTGRATDRVRQIDLVIAMGNALEGYTGNVLLRRSLRAMRMPARAAGLGELQSFLETGFARFSAMGGAGEFLDTIAWRERALAERLFQVDPVSIGAAPLSPEDPLGQLP